jgi:hypothetical protein
VQSVKTGNLKPETGKSEREEGNLKLETGDK